MDYLRFFSDEFTVHGVLLLNNWGGIELELSRCGEGLRYRFNFGEPSEDSFEAEIEYDSAGDAGFYATQGHAEPEWYSLQDFMRV